MDKQQKKEARQKFRLALIERELGGKELRAKIQDTSDQDRFDAWENKRTYGTETRWILLAYGLVKGVPYKAIEVRTQKQNAPSAFWIQAAAREVAGIDLSDDAVAAWLEGRLQGTAEPSPIEEEKAAAAAPSTKGLFARFLAAVVAFTGSGA